MRQPLYILAFIVLGLLFPAAERLDFLVRYFLMGMLFFSFLRIHPRELRPRLSHAWVLLAQIALGFGAYWVLRPIDDTLGQAAFIIGVAPTAAAAIVVSDLLKRDAGFIISSLLVTTLGLALVLPLLLSPILGQAAPLDRGALVGLVLVTIGLPFLASSAISLFSSHWRERITRFRHMVFYLFLANIFLASAKTGHFFAQQPAEALPFLLRTAAATALLCVLNFFVGYLVGGRRWNLETCIALGRKNTMLSIWLAIAFLSPLAVVGPMWYIFWQNVVDAFLLWRFGRRG